MLTLKGTNGQPQTILEWVATMDPEDRIALHEALAPYMKRPATETISLDKFRADFSRLNKKDCLEFIRGIQEGVAVAEAAIAEKAVDDAWAASVADAKARSEQAAKEVLG